MPAFASIYGGYTLGIGSIFNVQDFNESDIASARLAANLAFGAQIGWFSLGGTTSGPFLDPSCGPMGTFDYWMGNTSAPMVSYLQELVGYRSVLLPYFNAGRLMQPFTVSPTPFSFSADYLAYNHGYVYEVEDFQTLPKF